MRRSFGALLMALSVPAMAEQHHHCLNHHWASDVYSSEIYLQLQVILGIGLVWTVWSMISQARRKKRCG